MVRKETNAASVEPHVLTSWKEVAVYLSKGVRTVQRWERELGLPVRRPYGHEKHVIVALPEELDEWVHTRMRPRKHADARPASSLEERIEHLEKLRRLRAVLVERTKELQRRVELLNRSIPLKAGNRENLRLRSQEIDAETEKSRGGQFNENLS